MITLDGIGKIYRVAKRNKGLFPAVKSLFHREYAEVKAVDDVSFHVDEGEIVGFIGPNGAGKSTTIKIMGGILVPDAGRCSIMGLTPWKDRRRYVGQIGVVFGQRTQLWWDVPVQDSYDLLRDIYKIPPERYKDNLERLVDAMHLSHLLHTPLRQLSLGQRMGCEIVASLLHDPKILFLDEPTIGLDAVSKLAVRQFVARLNRERKVTVILTTHDMDDIGALTDRILLIGKGRILHDGSMREIRSRHDRIRTLSVDFASREEPVLVDGAELLSWENERAVYRVDADRANVSEVVVALGRALAVTDITVESRQLEEIIAGLYREHQV